MELLKVNKLTEPAGRGLGVLKVCSDGTEIYQSRCASALRVAPFLIDDKGQVE
jgi:hypothetical protein